MRLVGSGSSLYLSLHSDGTATGSCGAWEVTNTQNGLSLFALMNPRASSTISVDELPGRGPTRLPLRTKFVGSWWLGPALFWVANQWSNPWSPGVGSSPLNLLFRCHLPARQVAYPAAFSRAATVASDFGRTMPEPCGIQSLMPYRFGLRPVISA